MTCRISLGFAALLFVPVVAVAHFPFLHLKTEGGRSDLHVYFAESAEPDDPALLDRLDGAKTVQVNAAGQVTPFALSKYDDSLTASITDSGPTAFILTKDFGVLSRGDASFHLVYYAKTYTAPNAWSIPTGKLMPLDISPQRHDDRLLLTVSWQGKPVHDAEIVLQGGVEHLEARTDASGQFLCPALDPGLYSIRARNIVQEAGVIESQKFDTTRHYSTLTLDLK